MSLNHEIVLKEKRILDRMQQQNWKGLLLSRQNLFSWLTGGLENRVVNQSLFGNSFLFLTERNKYIIATPGEMGLVNTAPMQQNGYQPLYYNWDNEEGFFRTLKDISDSGNVVCDGGYSAFRDVYGDLIQLTKDLLPVENERYRNFGHDIAVVFTDFLNVIHPEFTEREAESILTALLIQKNIFPAVLMVGADENASEQRHFLAGSRQIKRRLTIIACLRREGLIISLTRDIYFGKIKVAEKAKHQLVSEICARLIAATACHKTYQELYQTAYQLYQKHNLTAAFHEHPIGGPTGYEIRYEMVNSNSNGVFRSGQAVAWNPTLIGFKSEDTWLIHENDLEQLCQDSWPRLEFEMEGKFIPRPGLLEI